MLPDSAIEANRWLRFAHDDLSAARLFLNNSPFLPNQACYHAQQSAEKALKAVLILYGILFPRTHDLSAIAACLPEEFASLVNEIDLVDLTSWAITSRYPGDWPEATLEDARIAIESAAIIVTNCQKVFQL